MQKQRLWWYGKVVALIAVAIIGGAGTAHAVTSTSPNYQVTEMQLGGSATHESCSGQYCSETTLGEVTSTPGASSAEFAEVLDDDPVLEMIIDPGESNLGVLTTDKTATKTMTVRIRNYMSGGYTLQILGQSPKLGDHFLNALSSPTASRPGSEQFGLNVVANTTPNVGSDVLQVPSSDVLFGVAADDYKTPNLFKYASGDVIARGVTESGRTDYTVSMIVNISSATPPGHYAGDFLAVVVPAY